MKKNKLAILIIVILFISTLWIYEITNKGNGDIFGGVFLAFISLLIPILVYRGSVAVKWIGVAGFSFMAIASILAGLENDEYLFYSMSLGYVYVVGQLLLIKSTASKDDGISIKNDIIDQHLMTNAVETAVIDNHHEYPLLIKRIQVIFIDGMLLLVVMIIVMVLSEESPNAVEIRVSVLLALALLYEPFLTVYASTLGQQLIGIRVRDYSDPTKRINLLQSYLRIITKGMLGWLSFITIHTNTERRAIHDLVAATVMVNVESKKS